MEKINFKDIPMVFQKIGVDIVDLDRLDLTRQHFIERILTPKELAIFHSKPTEIAKKEFLGGRFAGKEAVLKAIGKGLGGMKFQDIEILNKDSGEPYLNIENSMISISHDGNMAIAFVIIGN